MKEILEKLKAAFATLKARVDPYATEHELHLLASRVHEAAAEALGELHAQHEALAARVAMLERGTLAAVEDTTKGGGDATPGV